MNERIKEILSKINSPVGYIGNWGRVQWADNVYPQLGDDLYARVDLEKFAELIVQEFLDIASEVRGEPKTDTHFVIGYNRACEKMIDAIKEHFGVEG